MKKRSPIKHPPSRLPGQSLTDEIDRLWNEKAWFWVALACYTVASAIMEWWRVLTNSPPEPIQMTVLAVIVVAVAGFQLVRARKQSHAMQLGRDGERAVADILDRLKHSGAEVFHDVVAEGFNIDHVVVSPKGIYAIETKARSKNGDETVRFDRGALWAGASRWGSGPIDQARANARWLSRDLNQGTGKTFWVQPCLVFPGWFVEPTPREVLSKIWILNPAAVPAFIENEPERLSKADCSAAAYRLRTRERNQSSS